MSQAGSALVASAVDPDIAASIAIYEKLVPLKQALGVEQLTDQELHLFALVARHTGLDPFTRQIYAIKRAGRVTHQTGIDGYRAAAERTGQYAGSDEAEFEACTCGQDPKDHPLLARVVVHRILASGTVDQVGVARWHELYPGAGDVGAMWRKMPHNQLAKCAEANGLRKAFPRVFGSVYIADEVQAGPIVEGEARELPPAEARPTARDRIAARRAAKERPQAAASEADGDWLGEGTAGNLGDVDVEDAADELIADMESGREEPDLATTIRAAAAGSDLEGVPSSAQREALIAAFAGIPSDVTRAGIRAIFPEAIDEKGTAQLTAAQAAGILLVTGSTERAALRTAWEQLGQAVAS